MIATLSDTGFATKTCCRVLGVSSPGFYKYRNRPISPTQMRRLWLTTQIREIHLASRQTYGYRRVHAELTMGRDIAVSGRLVWRLMHNAQIAGLPGPAKRKNRRGIVTADDLVERRFHRDRPNELWVTDITEHRTREGKVYCCCVLDTWSRRIVGWSIDSVQNSNLVVNALDMAIKNRQPGPGGIVHADHGVQGGLNRPSQHLDHGGVRGNDAGAATRGPDLSGSDSVAGATDGGVAGGSGPVLGGDRSWDEDRGCFGGGWRVVAGRVPVVPSRWRREPMSASDGVGPLPLLR